MLMLCERTLCQLVHVLLQLLYVVPFVQHVQMKFGQSMLIVIPYMEHNDDGMVPVKFVLLNNIR